MPRAHIITLHKQSPQVICDQCRIDPAGESLLVEIHTIDPYQIWSGDGGDSDITCSICNTIIIHACDRSPTDDPFTCWVCDAIAIPIQDQDGNIIGSSCSGCANRNM